MILNTYFVRLGLRLLVFASALLAYLLAPTLLEFEQFTAERITFLNGLWLFLAGEMCLRFVDIPGVTMGSRKHFARHYRPAVPQPADKRLRSERREKNRGALRVLIVWLLFNLPVVLLYFHKVIGRAEMLLISMFYFVSDLICVIFYCPFQHLLMKNRCCIDCRIFNWDAAMAYTPMLFVPSAFGWSLFAIALLLLLRWEWVWHKHPERYLSSCSRTLQCAECGDKICRIKRSLGSIEKKKPTSR